jgi:hypothetical protein
MSHDPDELADELLEMINGSWKSQAVRAAAELRIADLLSHGSLAGNDLASATGTHAPSLCRLLRALVSLGILIEETDGAFALTPLGELLRTDSNRSLRAWSIWWGEYCWPAWEKLMYSLRNGQSAREMLNQSQGFEHLDRDPKAAEIFDTALMELTRLTTAEVLCAFDFSRFRHVIDVGGGYGELLSSILEAYPTLSGILFDRPHAIEAARARFASLGLDSRCHLIAGDFFQSIPAGGDAYVLKSIIHDWDDEHAAQILTRCREAMSPESTLLLVERMMPARLEVSKADQSIARSDLHMLVALGAKERTEAEFRKLLEQSGFRVGTITRAGMMNIIESRPAC